MAEGIVTVDAESPFLAGSRRRGLLFTLRRLPAKGFGKQQRLTLGDGSLFEVANAHVLL